MILGLAQRGQRIGRFPGLRDGHGEHAAVEDGLSVSELRGDIHLDREPREGLDEVLPDQRGVPRGPARHETESVETREITIPEPQLGDPDVGGFRVHAVADRVLKSLGLLEDLLEHEVRIP